MNARCILLFFCCAIIFTSLAVAIDGPTATAITNANWGTANDVWPHVARLELDWDGDGLFNDTDFNGSNFCTGTLIAPDVLVTAAHCFEPPNGALPGFTNPNLAPGNNIPANRVRVNFGNLPNGPSTFMNAGGRIHPAATFPVAVPSANDLAYVTLNGIADPATVSPIAIMPRIPRVGETNFATGFGVGNASGAGPAGAPSFGILQHLGGAPGRGAGAKGTATITIDGVTASHVSQTQNVGEDFTEGGDSGGPGIQRHIFPDRAWGANIVNFARNDFVMTAVHGGNTPTVSGGAFNYDTNPGMPGVQPGTDLWTRLDNQGNFLNAPIALGATQIFHNLPVNPAAANPNDEVKVLIRAAVNAFEPYTMNIRLWEEDNDFLATHTFLGDMTLAPTAFADDLAGFGHSSGVAPAGVSAVCAWQELTVRDLLAYDESLNPLDPPLDWVFHINYADAGQSVNPASSTLPQIDAQIANCNAGIAAGNTVRGGFAMVPEPAITAQLLVLLICFAIGGGRGRCHSG